MKFIADFVTTTQIIITCAATHNFPSSTQRYDGRWGTYIRLTIVGKVSEAHYLLSKKKDPLIKSTSSLSVLIFKVDIN